MSGTGPSRLVLVAVSPWGPPGLLGARAWDVLRAAHRVEIDTRHPGWPEALRAAGVAVSDGAGPSAPGAAPEPGSTLARLVDAAPASAPSRHPGGTDAAPPTTGEGAPEGLPAPEVLASARAEAARTGARLEVLAAAADPRGTELLDSVRIMDTLRAPGGDAWSARQTHRSLARYLLEESHEVLDVLEQPEQHAPGTLADELGDLLFQVLFHARLGEEETPPWSVDDVARALNAKLRRRSPHVFGADPQAVLAHRDDVDEIATLWHAVKAAEGRPEGILDSVPERLPALQRAAKAVHRARSRGALDELLAAADALEGPEADGPSWSRRLLALVVEAEARDEDPESSLRILLGRLAAADRAARGQG